MLEKLDVLLAKATEDEIKSDILPMIFSSLESNSIQGQVRELDRVQRREVIMHSLICAPASGNADLDCQQTFKFKFAEF